MEILFWVDDAIFYTESKTSVDDFILSLKDTFLLEREEDMAGFLGIIIMRKANTITMTQTGFTNLILGAMNMEDSNPKYTLADKDPLHKDLEGNPCCEEWEYRPIVGMMLYLAGITRPDIAYTVHQCARFSHNPRKSMRWELHT